MIPRRTTTTLALVAVLQLPLFGDTWLSADKVKHFFLSAVMQSVAYASLRAADVDRRDALRASISVTAAAGLSREIYDARVKGRFSLPDLAWDGAGIAAATAMLRGTR